MDPEPHDPPTAGPHREAYASGVCWQRRSDLLYHRCVDYTVRVVGAEARSMIDVGTAGCPYLEWFDWIPERVSMDLASPHRSEVVRGIVGDVLEHDFGGRRFALCTCLQVLEHVPEAAPFARRLLSIASTVIVSVPHRWRRGVTENHVHDPVGERDLARWMGRRPNYSIVVHEPFAQAAWGRRLIAVYDEDPKRVFGRGAIGARRLRGAAV